MHAFAARWLVPLTSVALLSGCSDTGALPLGQTQRGVATYYSATGDGACSFGPSPGDLDVAAINADQYDDAAYCGACVNVKGPMGSVNVRIVDLCPECDSGHLDLSQQAFGKIAQLEQGRVEIEWSLVSCEVTGNLRYHFKEGSSQWWTAIQVRNHRLPVESVEWKKGESWVGMDREDYNYFVAEDGVGPGPLTLRVTSVTGDELVDTLPGVGDDEVVEGSGQFPRFKAAEE